MLMVRHVSRAARFLAITLLATLAAVRPGFCQSDLPTTEPELLAILTGDAPPARKALACKGLAIHGSPASVAELAKLLPDPQLASWSRIALEVIPGKEADEALRQATESLEGNLLIGVINSIGIRHDAGAVELLTARLKDQNGEVAAAAAIALGHIGGSDAAKALQESLASAEPVLRNALAEGCILCAEQFHANSKATEATALYDVVREADVPKQRKLEGLRGAILARGDAGLPLLAEALQSEDKRVFQMALGTAREIPSKEVDKALATEYGRAAPERAAILIAVMADRPETANAALILKAAGPGPKPVRLAALSALGRVGNETSLSTLLDAGLDEDAEVVAAAQAALGSLPGDGINQEIVKRLSAADDNLMRLLIETIGQRRIDAVPELVKALDHKEQSVRAAALIALGNTVTPKSLDVLIAQAVAPKLADDGTAALAALKTASVRMPDREECAAQLAAALNRGTPAAKDAILEILSEMGGPKALETVGAAASGNDPQLQDTGSRLLGKWSTEDAAPVLLNLAKTSPSDKYHVRAVRGYISLARRFAAMPEPKRLEICQNALDVAKHPADKKLVLDVLQLYPTVASLQMAVRAREIPQLKDDATAAALTIAGKIKGNEEQVNEILAKAGLGKKKS